jgi:hypothetical protein
MTIGRPMRSDALLAQAGGDRRAAMDVLGTTIAGLLPVEYRGVYGG